MKTHQSRILFAALLGAAMVAGCNNSGSDEITETLSTSVAFQGEPDQRFVGTWKTPAGDAKYQIKPDGTYELDSKIIVRGQAPIESHLEGEWRAHGKQLLFKDGNGNVVPYDYSLTDKKLELSLTGKLKNTTTLLKQ